MDGFEKLMLSCGHLIVTGKLYFKGAETLNLPHGAFSTFTFTAATATRTSAYTPSIYRYTHAVTFFAL